VTHSFNIGITGFGVWARGLQGTEQFLAAHKAGYPKLADSEFVNPRPAAIAPRERRRAGLMINLAVEVAHQACEHAGVDKTQVPSVFTSAMGDTAITDYMCRKLAQPEKMLSPTKFHNSVHNAPSGYWTISAENRTPSSFVGGFRESFGAGLLEAASQAEAFVKPVLLVAYDITNSAPFHDIEPVDESLGLALVIAPVSVAGDHCLAQAQLSYCAEIETAQANQPSTPVSASLNLLATGNPLGGAMALLEMLAGCKVPEDAQGQTLNFPAAPSAHVVLQF